MAPRKPRGRDDESTERHLSQKPFAAMLEQFVVSDHNGMNSPFQGSSGVSISPALRTDLRNSRFEKTHKGRPDPLEEAMSLSLTSLDDIPQLGDLPGYDAKLTEIFDDNIEAIFSEDEDIALRNRLIAMGRKYAVRGEEDQDMSEVSRAFASQERDLDALYEEIARDAQEAQTIINRMQTSRTASYKSIADLMSAKTSMQTARLQILKEKSAIQKTKFDIKNKIQSAKNGMDADSTMGATQAVQRIFSLGRGALIAADDSSDDDDSSSGDPSPAGAEYHDGRGETEMYSHLETPEAETDGDKFIQYENDGVEYVLDINSETDERNVYAINKRGEVVPDYPMPSNVDELRFDINELSGEATDNLLRQYRVRRDGKDIASHDSPDGDYPDE